MTQEKLISRYESQLEKIKKSWGNGIVGSHQWERGQAYIKHAEEGLQAVKNGRNW